MQEIVDIHCHFINFNSFPDIYIDHLLRKGSKLFDECFDEEDFRDPNYKLRIIQWASNLFDNIYLAELINAFDDDHFWENGGVVQNLIRNGEYLVPGNFKPEYGQNRKGRIILYTPLMMDFIKAAGLGTLTDADGVIPLADQIENHSKAALKYPWQIMPFFHFHPGRKGVMTLLKEAINDKGFIGVKLYPAMGFYPDPDKNTNATIKNNLIDLYDYLHNQDSGYRVPMTVHTQYSSTQAIALEDLDDVMPFTDPDNWETVLENYELKINFAHFGGTEFSKTLTFTNRSQRAKDFSTHCRQKITEYMDTYNTDENDKRIFADTGAHSRHRSKYFECLNEDLSMASRPVMFGTDIPAITPRILVRDFVNDFIDNINAGNRNAFFRNNALDFLFDKKQISTAYIRFLKKSPESEPDPFDVSGVNYVEKAGDDSYQVVT